tara:strand:+ start:2881 stop:3417 length:537 start_codon:yes stop_codon:yes gene_type:complete
MNLLIEDNFFKNPDVLRRMALDCDYIDSEQVKIDVGWRGYRTDEFEVIGNEDLITASDEVRQAVCKHYNLEGYSISSHFHLSHLGTKKTLPDFENKKYHFDQCEYAGVVYLKPSPPKGTGTSILDGARNKIESVDNKYNRLTAYPAHHIHAPTDLFGNDFTTGRLTLTFFMAKDWTWD